MSRGMGRGLVGAVLAFAALVASSARAAEGDDRIFTFFKMNQNEVRSGSHISHVWKAHGWIGTDFDKAFVKAESETELGEAVEAAEVQLLYSRLISDFFDAQAGIRHDMEPEPSRTHVVLALHGLAPQFFELDASVFLSEEADLSARFEVEYELLITQRLVLQPAMEIDAFARDVDELEVGSGLSHIELGLRLRYEFLREFAPYIGVAYERDLFETAARARGHAEDVDSLSFVAGVRLFF